MNLKVLDRLMISNLLIPKEGTFIDMALAREVQKKVSFSAETVETFGIKQMGQELTWNPDADTGTEIAFNATEIAYLQTQVDRLDAAGKIDMRALDVCAAIREAK